MNQKRLAKFKTIFESKLESLQPAPLFVQTSGTSKTQQELFESSPLTADPSPGNSISSPKITQFLDQIPGVADRTSQRFLFFDGNFSTDLRTQCKANGTTIASALIVIGLAAVKVTFAARISEKGMKMPRHQGWIVTSSMRHLLPNSKLLEGSDKQTDPSLMTFGGYGGSISNPKLKVIDSTNFWKQCRLVRKSIGQQFFPSMRRMKLMNWVHRHPRIWNWLETKADLKKATRTYSVELANLGAWDHPCATSQSPPDDDRVRCTWFSGSLNNSFIGARALFSIGVVTLDNDLSITIAYNSATISEADADLFASTFKNGLVHIQSQETKKIRVRELFSIQ